MESNSKKGSKPVRYPLLKANLKWLRDKHRYSQQSLSDKLGVARGAYAMWEGGYARPNNLEDEKRIVDLFNITVDDLYNKELSSQQKKYPVFAEKLRHLRLLSKKTQKETADQLNIETVLYESWEDGKARPEGEWGSMLANMFKVSASDLFNEALSCEAMMKNHDVDNSEVVIPIYGEHGAIATPNNGMVSDTGGQPSEYRRMARSLFDDAEAVLPVYGNSMTPNYPPSTELALKVDNSAPGYIDFGEVYVLELHGSDIPLFKRVLPSAIPGQVILASDNEMIRESGPFRGDYYYPPQPIDIDKVRRWWAVIGDQKRRKNKQIMLRGLREQQHQ